MSFSVVIPSRNADNLAPCVAALARNEPGLRLIVVDDGIQEPMLGITVVEGIKPFIFARNVNLGIRAAGDDDVIILNDDALLETPFGFTAMYAEARNRPEYGLIGATCNNVGNPNQRPRKLGMLREKIRDEPRMVCFVCVLIPRRTIETVGLLDERYTQYGCDDDDYSFSVRKAGLKLGIYDGCYVDHGSLKSSYRGDATAGGDFRPNLARFIQKWGTDNWGRSRETSHFPELFPQVDRNAA